MTILIGALYFLVVIVALVLIGIILIQDSKAGGLTSAFGGGGGDSLLGATGQKQISKVTAYISVVFFGLCILIGVLDVNKGTQTLAGEDDAQLTAPGDGGAVGNGASQNGSGQPGNGSGAPGSGTGNGAGTGSTGGNKPGGTPDRLDPDQNKGDPLKPTDPITGNPIPQIPEGASTPGETKPGAGEQKPPSGDGNTPPTGDGG